MKRSVTMGALSLLAVNINPLHTARSGSAALFRLLFRARALHRHFYGWSEKIVRPLNLFRGVTKRVRYRKNIRLDLQIDDWIQQIIYFLGEYEEAEIRFVESRLQPGDVFVDAGANFGLFSLAAARRTGSEGRVYAFEPYTPNYHRLVHHVKLNALSRIITERMALSQHEGTVAVGVERSEYNSGMASMFAGDDAASEMVQTIRLDTYLENHQERSVRMIKIDLEGAEYAALEGMKRTLAKYHPDVLIEIDPRMQAKAGVAPGSVEKLLQELGYNPFFLDADGRPVDKAPIGSQSFNRAFLFSATAAL